MAYAFRLGDPRVAYIRLSRADLGEASAGAKLCFAIRLGDAERPLRGALRQDMLSIIDELCDIERALQLSATLQPRVVIRQACARPGAAETLHDEPLLFHHSFFAPIVDYSRAFPHGEADAPNGPGETGGVQERPAALAVFTHVYDDNAMLRFWEAHYARLAPHGDLFVIDHGSPTSPRLLLHPETNVVRLPRGVTDHAEIARFCSRFQRFLLSEYRWVLHTDADELLVHAQGNAALLARLARPNAAGSACILAPEHAVDVIQRLGDEGPLRLGEPLGPQRGFMRSNAMYRKPALACEPASWSQGFHQVYEEARVGVEPDLWLLHLQAADFDLLLRKNRAWNAIRQSGADRLISPQQRPDDEESLRAWFARAYADKGFVPIPWELRRQF